jgi:hypothetical protein
MGKNDPQRERLVEVKNLARTSLDNVNKSISKYRLSQKTDEARLRECQEVILDLQGKIADKAEEASTLLRSIPILEYKIIIKTASRERIQKEIGRLDGTMEEFYIPILLEELQRRDAGICTLPGQVVNEVASQT